MLKNLESLAVFTQVVEQKSFTAAAQMLHLSPSAVSKHISRLEADLGLSLLNRSTRNLHVSEAGNELYRRCKRALFEIQDAQSAAKATHAGLGTLRLHITSGIGQRLVEPAVARFMTEHPDLSLQLTKSAEIVNPLEQGLDLVIRSGSPDDAHMRHSSLMFREFGPLRYLVCAAPDYLRRHGQPREPADLAKHNCLIHATQVAANAWRFRGKDGEYSVPVAGTVVSNSHTMIYVAAAAGLGIARILTLESGDGRELGGLTPLFAEETVSHTIIRAFYPRTEQVPAKVTAFLDFLSRELAGREAREADHRHTGKTRLAKAG